MQIFKTLLYRLSKSHHTEVEQEHWHNHRVFFVDGSTFSMPDTEELQESFGLPPGQKPGCGFPTAGLLAMVHWSTGLILDLCAMPWSQHEQSKVATIHPSLTEGDVLVADRGFSSYYHLTQLYKFGIDAIFRVHQRQIVDFTPGRPHAPKIPKLPQHMGMPRSKWIKSLGFRDQIDTWYKPTTCPKHITRDTWNQLDDELIVRELSYRIEAAGYRTREITLVTTLLDLTQYTKQALSDLYLMRWRIELNFRDLKTTMGMDVLKCKTYEGILKELYVFAMVYNMVMMTRYRIAEQMGVDPFRLSFVDILRYIRLHGYQLPGTVIVNPIRPGRWQPRVKKRRPKTYPMMTKPRNEYVMGDDKRS